MIVNTLISWAEFKTCVERFTLTMQSFETSTMYKILGVNSQNYAMFTCIIKKYDEDNCLDFEQNYKSLSNNIQLVE